MGSPLYILGILAMAAVVAALAIGIGGFGVGGDFNRRNGNKMMRLRIFFQFLAVVLMVAFVYFSGGGN
ncbi:twin transmembrane helix small protein [Phaeobacter sp. B1627]|uniref:twin transmembrane helix small protein n=1 Tax=Phaeobacter sp. B1627 TaxID=2583809 RepID=UPI0011187D61|nr:twin transmembrane helix small protein [Phaeobacter sp. B1627]TNJ41183.1 twin transmembrane helix small protein [Phaeobacter sp. B1627]